LEIAEVGQMLAIALPVCATAQCRLQKRLCSIYEQSDLRCAAAIVQLDVRAPALLRLSP
jgi:hypothetical protein